MPTQRKKTVRKKTASGTKKPRSAVLKTKKPSVKGANDEVYILITLAFALMLFLANFHLLGAVGEFFRGLQFGLFGVTAYIFPIILGTGVVLWFLYADRDGFYTRLIQCLAIYLSVCIIAHLPVISEQKNSGDNPFVFCRDNSKGGGVLAGYLAGGMYDAMGVAGAWIVTIMLVVILLMMLTGGSIFDLIETGSIYIERQAIEKERRSLEREEKKKERQERSRALREQNRLEKEKLEEKRREKMERLESERQAAQHSDFNQSLAEDSPVIPFMPSVDQDEDYVPAPDNSEIIMDEPEYYDDDEPEFYDDDESETEAEEYPEEDAVPEEGDPERVYEEDHAEQVPEFKVEELAPVEFDYDAFEFPPVPVKAEMPVSHANRENTGVPMAGGNENSAEISVADDVTDMEPEAESPGISAGENGTEPETYESDVPVQESNIYEQDPGEKTTAVNVAGKSAVAAAYSGSIFAEKSDINRDSSTGKVFSDTSKPAAKKPDDHPGNEGGKREWKLPKLEDEYLNMPSRDDNTDYGAELERTKEALRDALDSFGIKVEMKGASRGPSVTRYEILPQRGVKVSRITNLADDLMLALAASGIRIEAPIPGKSAVGIEVPNKKATMVSMYELLADKEYSSFKGDLAFAVGKGISGKTVVTDVAKMPHVLVAGTTGSGKSVCVNTLLMSLLFKYTPDELKLIMIDPKIVELSVYNGIPHLLVPVVTDPRQAAAALHWAVVEMDERYEKFELLGVRNLEGYNKKIQERMEGVPDSYEPLPKIVVILDELADLMMVAGKEVEESICRLLQKARACGIHLVIATQRPSVDVITGLIKANLPSRIAFKVGSMIDSRTILDTGGAEKLLGKGDMLFYPQGYTKPERVQGAFVSDQEVANVVKFWKDQADGDVYDQRIHEHMKNAATAQNPAKGQAASEAADEGGGRDEYFIDAARFIIEKDKASAGMLQRKFKIGFNRAANLMDAMAELGIVGEENGTKPREVIMSMEKFENMLEQGEI